MNKYIHLLLVICFATAYISSTSIGDDDSNRYPFTITDSKGHTLSFDHPIERVVCTTTQHLETFRSLNVSKDIIVGIPDIKDYSYFSDFQGATQIGHFYEPDVETILSLSPDVVIFHPGPGPMGNSLDPTIQKLEDAGVNVLLFYCNQPERYSYEVKALGHLFGKETECDRFLEFYNGSLDSIEDVVSILPDDQKPKVYCEYDRYATSKLDVYPIEMAGGKYIFADQDIVNEVDPEAVVTANPDIILRLAWDSDYDAKDPLDVSKMKQFRDEILSRPELQNVSAVVNKRVYVIAAPLWVYLPYSSSRNFVGIAYLAKWFHPDLFSTLEPEEIHQRYLNDFQGLDQDLTKRGLYVYPQS